ncbi:MAG: DUF885 domain-containing protein, partial [Chthoniobacterales bacterium]
MFKRVLKWLGGIAFLLLLVAAVFAVNAIWFRPWSLNVFYDKIFLELLFDEPELLSSLGLVEQFGITGHNGKLSDASPAHQQKGFDRIRRSLAQLHQYPLEKQTASQRLSTAVLDWYLTSEAEREKWQWHDYPVNQMFGVQNQFPSFMANTHRLHGARDCEYYVERLRALPVKFDQLLEGLKLREEKQITPPRFVVERVLQEMTAFVAQPPAENILATSFRTRAAKIAELTDAQRSDLQAEVEGAIRQQVYPAYQKLIDYFTALLPHTTTDDGVWKLPDGDAFYAYKLQQQTTAKVNPEEIHALGVAEVARIETEMRALLDANGFAGQPIAAAMTVVSKDPRFLFPDNDEGRAAVIAEHTRLIDQALERSTKLFLTIPRAKIDVRRLPAYREATSAIASYEPPALDGSRPGIFFVNLRDMSAIVKPAMSTLAYHEGVPGHHFQLSIAQEITGVPQFRKVIPFSAYAEGWALYTEWLAKDAGWYEGQPFADLCRLQAELFRAVRLMVDTGMHAKRWTREQAIAYMVEKTGFTETDVTAEIERYIVMPGQACAYKVGMLKIRELRTRAETALGAKFDLREFHDVVLKKGALPMEILEQQVDEYIAR